MSARRMTRRSLLAATAGTVAGGLVHPGGVLAALARTPRPRVQSRWVGRLVPGELATIELASVADLVGVQWQAPARDWRAPGGTSVELRVRTPGGGWSAWIAAGDGGHGEDAPVVSDSVAGEPVWTGGTTAVQVRSSRSLSAVRMCLIDVSGGLGARTRAAAAEAFGSSVSLPLATPALAAGSGQPPIIARRAWGRGMAHPRVAPDYGAVRLAFVHHTENPNGYSPGEVPAMLLAIFLFHRDVRGWNDIGYNFVVDRYGRVFEARAGGVDEPVVGAHAGGYNLVSTGVAVLGSFASQPISLAAQQALERLLAWKLSLHGVPAEGRVTVHVNPAGAVYSRFPANARVSLPRIAGHRDGDSTDCPGDALYGELPSIRPRVQRLASRPARATLALSTPPAPQAPTAAPGEQTPPAQPTSTSTEAPPPGAAGALAGDLRLLDGTPIAGAPITVQARSVSEHGEVVRERTIAQAVTNAEGRWSLAVTLAGTSKAGTWLRALYAGPSPGAAGSPAGATVSDPLHVAAAAVTPSAASPPTPAAAPPPAQ
jgi:hypothetical protein